MRTGAFRIALLYAFFGGVWIAVSDRALEALVADAHAMSVVQSYKGWGFVALSALLIYAVVRRELGARARAEAALSSSEERYRTLIDLASDAIIVVDVDTGLIIDANRKAGELVGLPREKLLGMHADEARGHLTLGNLYAEHLGDHTRARRHYERVLQLDPRNPQAQSIRYWLVAHPN